MRGRREKLVRLKHTLRPYQHDAVAKVLAYAAQNPTGRLLVVIPTRGGKTFVGTTIVLLLAVKQQRRALWIVHREELLDEAVAHLKDVGIPASDIGVIKAGRRSDPSAPVQVASEATLDRRNRPEAHVVVTDEAHRDTAPRRRRLRRAYPNALLIGLTATPKPPPQRDLGEDYDALMVVVQPSELIHDGYLAAPVVFAPEKDATPDLRGLCVVSGDYRPEDLEPLLVGQAMLDEQVREWARLSEGRTSIAFPVTCAHSKALVARFRAAGIKAEHLDGETRPEDRKNLVDGLRNGRIPIVSSVGVLSEGTNIPRVKCVLMVCPTRSLARHIQPTMRGSTPWENVRPRVLDVVGNVYRHGLPHDDRHWSLVNAESGTLLSGERSVVRRCGECGAMSPSIAPTCTNCGACFRSSTPSPSLPLAPLQLQEVSPTRSKWSVERTSLVEYAKRQQFASPEQWADRVLATKYGGGHGRA